MSLGDMSSHVGVPSPFSPGESTRRVMTSGFPSPAEDYLNPSIDLNRELIHHPSSTFFLRVKGHSMTRSGVNNGDLLIVDRSLDPTPGNVVVVLLDGSFTLKRLANNNGLPLLKTDSPGESPIDLSHCNEAQIWGVAIYSIHYLSLKQLPED